jgi:hypothetical protein
MKYPKTPGPPSDTDEQHSDIEEGQQQRHHQTAMASSAPSISTTTSRPAKDSAEYCRQVLEPRGIKIIAESFDPNATAKLPLAPTSALAKALNRAFVNFDSAKLMEACQFAKGEYNEAQWTAEVYQMYFLLTNPDPNEGGVRRMVQHPFSWSGKASNVCLPPVVDFDRRSSGLYEYSQIWYIPTDQKSRSDTTCWPDHCYFVLPELTAQAQLRNYTTLPGFRTGLSHNNRIISCPPYFITEDKAWADFECEARQYLAFIAAFLLQERLLLRHLTDKAQDELEIHFDESLCVYAMTNCGPVSTIYKMIVRNEFTNLGDSKVKKAVRFDLVKLCDMDLTIEAHCEQLKVWVNYIHHWGKTVHMPAVMAEGSEASQSKYYINGGWKETLARKSFYYSATGIAFETLEYDYLGLRASQVPGEVEVSGVEFTRRSREMYILLTLILTLHHSHAEDSMNSATKKQPPCTRPTSNTVNLFQPSYWLFRT